MASQTLPQPRSDRHTGTQIILLLLQIAIASVLMMAGIPKLKGDPMMVQVFGAVGLGQWFRYLTGALEVGASVALFIPGISGYAALVISAIMLGAIFTHLFILGGSFLTPALILAASLVIAWARLWRRL